MGRRSSEAASVLCIGTGGLGFSLYCSTWQLPGIGRIGIVDFDIVDQSNLQRQIIHGQSLGGQTQD